MDDRTKTNKQTLVEEGTELKGTLKSSCPVVVNGAIDGEIDAPSLTVTASGRVLGTVKAARLRSDGTLAGDIDAEDVYLAGTVRSNTVIRARSLEVKLAPKRGKLEVSFGECLLEVGDDPAVDAEQPNGRSDAASPEAPSEASAVASAGKVASNGGAASEDARNGKPSEAPPAVEQGEAPSSAATDGADAEPSWSSPPAAAGNAGREAVGDDANASEAKVARRSKRSANRESQRPGA